MTARIYATMTTTRRGQIELKAAVARSRLFSPGMSLCGLMMVTLRPSPSSIRNRFRDRKPVCPAGKRRQRRRYYYYYTNRRKLTATYLYIYSYTFYNNDDDTSNNNNNNKNCPAGCFWRRNIAAAVLHDLRRDTIVDGVSLFVRLFLPYIIIHKIITDNYNAA